MRGPATLRVAYVTDQPLPRTATDAEQLVSAASALAAAGADVDLLLPKHALKETASAEDIAAFYEVPPTFGVLPVRGLTPTFRGLEKVVHGWAAARHPRVKRADLLYTRNLPSVMAALRRGLPTVYETYRPWPTQRPRTRRFFRRLFAHPRFLGAVLHSQLAAESYRYVGATEDQLLVAHNGYNPARMAPVLPQAQARYATGLPADRPIVVYAGHVSPEKGLGLVLDLAERIPEAEFVLVGSKGTGPIETRAAIMENVHIVAWQPFSATVPYLYAADVLLIPPTRGPLADVGNTVLPMKTFLYMAAGRPIFGPATPDLLEVIDDGVSGRLVAPDNLNAATEALRGLLSAPDLRARLAAEARRHVRTWQERGEVIRSFLERQRAAVSP
ncbi:MAG: glycosyltransferase [Bacteroidota bacterium]